MASVAIVMGSKSDSEHARKIAAALREFGINSELRVASAHKTPAKVLGLAKELEKKNAVVIAVAGLSNALSGMLAGVSAVPVITCPPNTDDILSSLRMPSGIAHATVLGAGNAALFAAKIIGRSDASVRRKVAEALRRNARVVEDADAELR